MPKLTIRDSALLAAIDAHRTILQRRHPGVRISRESAARALLYDALHRRRIRGESRQPAPSRGHSAAL